MSENYKEEYKGCIGACVPLQYSHVVIDEIISGGKSCVQFKVHDLFDHNKQYALKMYFPVANTEKTLPFLVGHWKREVDIMLKANGRGLTPFLEEYGKTNINGHTFQYILMEYINGQTIQALLKNNYIDLHARREIMNKVFINSIKLSDMGIWHVNGHLNNYMVTNDNQVKFIDFGNSYISLNKDNNIVEKLNNFEYNKKECMALGMLLFNLLFNKGISKNNIYEELIQACIDERVLPNVIYLAMKGGFSNINEFMVKVNDCLNGKKVF